MECYNKNTTYFFLPFRVKSSDPRHKQKNAYSTEWNGDRNVFLEIRKKIEQSSQWDFQTDELIYFLKYITETICNKENPEKNRFFHAVLRNPMIHQWFQTDRTVKNVDSLQNMDSLQNVDSLQKKHSDSFPIRFQLQSVQLFLFDTLIGICAFQVYYDPEFYSDPKQIAEANYYLKKVGREKIRRENDENSEPTTFMEMAQILLDEFKGDQREFELFFYVNKGCERANQFVYVEIPEMSEQEYLEKLFYLRNSHRSSIQYIPEGIFQEQQREEIHIPTNETIWGNSQEATVCMACHYHREQQRAFLENRFYPNFNSQYMFMYVYLLHQKYVLYGFMTRISECDLNDIEDLEDYCNKLMDYELHFENSVISEVFQYQKLYEKMREVFALKKMNQDIHEPIYALSRKKEKETEQAEKKYREKQEEKRQSKELAKEKQEKKLNTVLFMLSMLGVFSALVDSYDFFGSGKVDSLKSLLNLNVAQWLALMIIVIVSAYILSYLVKVLIQKLRRFRAD